jgi:carboxyl-terminal processing protease
MKSSLIIFGLFISLSCFSQEKQEVKTFVDSALTLLKEKSLYADRVNWKKVKKQSHRLAKNAQTIEESFEAIQYAFSSLKDHHGMMRLGKKEFRLEGEGMPKQDSLITSIIMKGPKIVIRKMGDVGYVKIPHMPLTTQTQIDKYANMLNDSVCRLSNLGVKKWIIDLRLNAGGNFRPMLAGINSLLCDMALGSFVNNKDKMTDSFEISGKQLFINGKQEVSIKNSCVTSCDQPVGVLLGSSTGSSGEVTAIALTSRANTKFFGERTFGFANSTQGFYLAGKKAYFLLTTAQLKNGKGKAFDHWLEPDFKFQHAYNPDVEKDQLVDEALKWLNIQK